jgi:dephospho-CoA kinase
MVLLIGLTGMPGSGKGTTHDIAKEYKIPIVQMGDIVRGEAKKLGLPLTCEVLGGIALSLRAEGLDAVAIRSGKVIRKMIKDNPKIKVIMIDGVRSIQEIRYFKQKFDPFELIAVYSPPRIRFERLLKRQRTDDHTNWRQFEIRDHREILLGIGGAIALADYVIMNTGTLEELYKNSQDVINRILAKHNLGVS